MQFNDSYRIPNKFCTLDMYCNEKNFLKSLLKSYQYQLTDAEFGTS